MGEVQEQQSQGSLEIVALMQAAQTAAQGFVQQSANAVPLEKERTKQLEIRAAHAREELRWNNGMLLAVLMALGVAVGYSFWSQQWLIATHIVAAGLAFLAGRRSNAPPPQPNSQ